MIQVDTFIYLQFLTLMDKTNHIFNNVEDSLDAPVDENDISFENYALPVFRQPRQASIQIDGQRLMPIDLRQCAARNLSRAGVPEA